jgi:hypothetical protein
MRRRAPSDHETLDHNLRVKAPAGASLPTERCAARNNVSAATPASPRHTTSAPSSPGASVEAAKVGTGVMGQHPVGSPVSGGYQHVDPRTPKSTGPGVFFDERT